MKYALGTIIGTSLLGFAKARKGGASRYRPRKIENLYSLSPQEKKQTTEIDLSRKRLTELHDDIFDGFINLEKLNLKENRLTKLPNSIGNLTNLTKLYVSGNILTELPDSIGNLTNLEKLRLRYNQLTELPDSIGNLTNLKELNLRYNDLTELPQSLGNLTNLERLWLDHNPWQKRISKETIVKMIQNGVNKGVIKNIIDMNNSIQTKSKSDLRIR